VAYLYSLAHIPLSGVLRIGGSFSTRSACHFGGLGGGGESCLAKLGPRSAGGVLGGVVASHQEDTADRPLQKPPVYKCR